MRTAYAGVSTTVQEYQGSGITTIGDAFGFAINLIIMVGWGLTFLMLALGFIKYITSRGETKATDSARQWLTYAAIGGVGLLFLTVIRSIIVSLLDVQNVDNANFDPFQ